MLQLRELDGVLMIEGTLPSMERFPNKERFPNNFRHIEAQSMQQMRHNSGRGETEDDAVPPELLEVARDLAEQVGGLESLRSQIDQLRDDPTWTPGFRGINLGGLSLAWNFIDRCGGVELAHRVLDTMEQSAAS